MIYLLFLAKILLIANQNLHFCKLYSRQQILKQHNYFQVFKIMQEKEQLTLNQKRRNIIISYLSLDEDSTEKGSRQKQCSIMAQRQAKSVQQETLEALIQSLEYQQTQIYPNTIFNEKIFCQYSHQRIAQFVCCFKYCEKHSIMCGDQTCKCASDHQRCSFISIKLYIDQIISKITKSIPKYAQLYFQIKNVIYDHIINRISQQRDALIDWQQNIGTKSQKILFLYGFSQFQGTSKKQPIACHAPKVLCSQKISNDHQKCGCSAFQIRESDIKANKRQKFKEVCNQIEKKYSSIINYLDQKIDKLNHHRECANLNTAQLLFIDNLKHINNFSKQEFANQKLYQTKGQKKMSIVPGSTIYLSRQHKRKQQDLFVVGLFDIKKIIKIWKNCSQKVFRLSLEGKAMNGLFRQIIKAKHLKNHSAQQLRSRIDQIIQDLGQKQSQHFSNSIPQKNIKFVNLETNQLKKNLQKCQGMQYNEVYISNSISHRAVNSMAIKELGKLKNVTKLQIRWCCNMRAQVSIQILNAMPNLRYLALLGHHQKLSWNFMAKLCQYKQLTKFYLNKYSNPEYYRRYREDLPFINLFKYQLADQNLPTAEQLIDLIRVSKLDNIEICRVNDSKNIELIKNIKVLKHITLGNNQCNKDNLKESLIKDLKNLRTLSLVGLKLKESKLIDNLIANNPHLSTIIIRSDCNLGVTDGTIEHMSNLIQLQNLCISCNPVITGKHLRKLDSLITLELIKCQNICKDNVKQALGKMQKLKHLDLTGNDWFDDEVVMNLQSCKQITYLNIQGTQVSSEGLKYLEGLNSLSMLFCAYTKISGKNLIEFTKRVSSITRLLVNALNINDNELLEISANCQSLTHLNIIETKITQQSLLNIKHLKVVRSYLNRNQLYRLHQAKIKTY